MFFRTLWVRKAIVERLVGRFTLSGTKDVAAPWGLSDLITPVTDIGDLLRETKIFTQFFVCTGAGWHDVQVVPLGKRWVLSSFDCTRTVGVNDTISGLAIKDTSANFIPVDTFTATSTVTRRINPVVSIDQGWTIQINVAGFFVGDTYRLKILVEEEDAY